MPDACAMITEQEATIQQEQQHSSKCVSVRLNMRPGQTLNSKLIFFQPSRTCLKLGLTLEATPLIEVSSRAVYVLFNNCTAQDIHVPKASHLGWLLNQAFHNFELTVPVIGPIPAQLTSDECNDTITFTKPHEIIAITSILPVSRESVCHSELTNDTHLAVYAVSTQPAAELPTQVTIGAQSPSNDLTAEEPYAGFNAKIQQILSEADALHNEVDRQGLLESRGSAQGQGFPGLWTDQHPHGAHPNKPKCATHICVTVQDSNSVIWASAINYWLHAGKGGHPAL